MRRLLAAGVLVLAASLLASFALAGKSKAGPQLAHTCSATDRQFLMTAELNMTALDVWADGYLHGEAEAGEVVAELKRAAKIIGATRPTDPSLDQARRLLRSMFVEYGRAVSRRAQGGDASRKLYRAYALANYARGVLLKAQPALGALGCDVQSLL